MQKDEIPGGALSLNLLTYPDHGHHGNLQKKSCKENQNTHFVFKGFFYSKIVRL